MCGYDQRFAKEFINRCDEYGIATEVIQQNAATLSNATKLVEADLKARRINYGNNPVDKWCFGNASLQVDNTGRVLVVKINNQANKRIDGAVTCNILYEVLRRYKSEYQKYIR